MSKKHQKSKQQDAASVTEASPSASLEANTSVLCHECVSSPLLLNNFQFFQMTSFRFLAVLLYCQNSLWHTHNYLTDSSVFFCWKWWVLPVAEVSQVFFFIFKKQQKKVSVNSFFVCLFFVPWAHTGVTPIKHVVRFNCDLWSQNWNNGSFKCKHGNSPDS